MKDEEIPSTNTVASNVNNRCRAILIAPVHENAAGQVREALSGGDVASVIIAKGGLSEQAYRVHAEAIVPLVQLAGAAALLVDDTQLLGRTEADGMFVPSGLENLKAMLARFSPKKIVGYGGAKERHSALEAGELNPDFIFFGKIDGDIKAKAHPKNLGLAEWWSTMIEVPIVVMAGSSIDSVVEVAENGADFVALNLAVFDHADGPAAAVAKVNELLDRHAPLLNEEN